MKTSSKPLTGLRVVALEQAVAAPLCTRHLVELGADVVKVERPVGGDFARAYDNVMGDTSTHFAWLNRGKRSLAVDLKHSEGRKVFLRLVAEADVLVSNLSPGAAERLLSDAELAEANPRLLHCSISGYGTSGPLRNRKAFDLLVQGETGATMNTGLPGQPAKPGVSMADLATGLYALASILAERLGDGSARGYRHVEIAMFDVMAEWMMPLLLAQLEEGRVTPPAGLHHTSIAPYGAFLTGDDEYVNIAVQHEKHWRVLCEDVLHDSSLVSEPLFATNESRVENRELLAKRIEETTCTISAEELGRRLDEAGIAWGRLNDAEAMVDHPQLVSRDRWTDAVSPTGRPLRVLRSPLPGGNDEVRGKVPALGEHTDAVLSSLGYDRDAIAKLEEIGVVTTHRTTIDAHPGQEEENQ